MRPLDPCERELLDWFLGRDAAWARAAKRALREAAVTAVCACGCGTLRLSVDPEAAAGLPQPLPLEGIGQVGGGSIVAVQLYVEPSGALLELGWSPEPPEPLELPRPEALEVAPWSGASILLPR